MEGPQPPKRSRHCPDEPCHQFNEGTPRSTDARHESDHWEQIRRREQRGCHLFPGATEPPVIGGGEKPVTHNRRNPVLSTKSNLARPDLAQGHHHRSTLGTKTYQSQSVATTIRGWVHVGSGAANAILVHLSGCARGGLQRRPGEGTWEEGSDS
jgi:hypothetical protein